MRMLAPVKATLEPRRGATPAPETGGTRRFGRPPRAAGSNPPAAIAGTGAATLAAGRVPRVEAAQLHPQHGGLQAVESLVEAGLQMLALARAGRGCAAAALRSAIVVVVRADRAAVAERAEVLARVEAEGGGVPSEPARPAAPSSPRAPGRRPRARARPWRPGERVDRVHVADLPVEMDRDDRRRSRWTTASAAESNVDQPGLVLHVAEDRRRPGVEDGERRRDEGVGRDDHLVAAARFRPRSSASVSAAVPEPTPTQWRAPQ